GRQLAAWLTIRAAQTIPGDAPLPSTRSGKAWSKASSTVAFQRVLARAGITSPTGGTFKLRHTFALRQLERHAPHEVARWLGVQDPAIMERYRRVLYRPVDVV
ncbi:MAG: integrase, partial [Burkholderiales bacterium]